MAGGLEARYRRVLRWFPREHRERHGEEILGVLLAAAPPGRDRPGLAEMADLLGSAARLRLRPGRALSDRAGWRDFLAMYSIAAPVVTTVAALVTYAATNLWTAAGGLGLTTRMPWTIDLQYPTNFLWLAISSQLVVTVLALAGLRRWAAAAVAVPLAYQTAANMWILPHSADPRQMYLAATFLPAITFQVTEIVALLASPGPRYGRKLMQRRHWVIAACLVCVSILFGVTGFAVNTALLQSQRMLTIAESGVLTLFVMVAWLTSANGKRLAVIVAILSCSTWETLVYWYGASSPVPGYTFGITFDVLALGLPAVLIIRRLLARQQDGDHGTVA